MKRPLEVWPPPCTSECARAAAHCMAFLIIAFRAAVTPWLSIVADYYDDDNFKVSVAIQLIL